jgi:hypothetical protein
VRDTGDNINGGAVSDAKSPEKDAMDFKKDVQLVLWAAGTASPGVSVMTICYEIVEARK